MDLKRNNNDRQEIPSDFIFMINQAVLAPSGHNTQPWKFRLYEDRIEIHPDLERGLGVVDPDNRELFISLGCAAENIYLSALSKGYMPEISVCENGVITLFLSEKNNDVTSCLLAEQIVKRQTNRGLYNGKIIPETEISVLRGILLESGIHMYIMQNGTSVFERLSDYVLKGNAEQLHSKAFKTELKSWMRYNSGHEKETQDGLSYAVFGAPDLPRCLSELIMGMCLTSGIQNMGDKKKIKYSSHFVLFTTEYNCLSEWISVGRSLERFLLKATELGIACAFLNQPCESASLSHEIQRIAMFEGQYPVLLLRIGYASKMPQSLRRNISDVVFT
ncbi:MAG: nitroreductase [Bacteroidales bacterium]|nr:nitroreductase [Bacteroidales bacterium]